MSRWTFLKNLFRTASKDVKPSSFSWVKSWTSDGVKNVVRTSVRSGSGTVVKGARVASKSLLTFGNAAKASIVAFGGVVAYYFFEGGAVNAVSALLGTSDSESSLILIIVGMTILAFVLTYIFRKIGHSERRPFIQKKRY